MISSTSAGSGADSRSRRGEVTPLPFAVAPRNRSDRRNAAGTAVAARHSTSDRAPAQLTAPTAQRRSIESPATQSSRTPPFSTRNSSGAAGIASATTFKASRMARPPRRHRRGAGSPMTDVRPVTSSHGMS